MFAVLNPIKNYGVPHLMLTKGPEAQQWVEVYAGMNDLEGHGMLIPRSFADSLVAMLPLNAAQDELAGLCTEVYGAGGDQCAAWQSEEVSGVRPSLRDSCQRQVLPWHAFGARHHPTSEPLRLESHVAGKASCCRLMRPPGSKA